MTRVAILASGNGSNAQALIDHFKNDDEIEIALIGSNRNSAAVLEKASLSGIETLSFSKDQMNSGDLLSDLKSNNIDWVLLSGFLLKIPAALIESYEGKILNIHPSLLPKFGGKGMYGMNVHNAVFDSDESESGMTIHKVTENYDEGDIVFQVKVDISQCHTPEEIASKVLALEHHYYPRIAEAMIKS